MSRSHGDRLSMAASGVQPKPGAYTPTVTWTGNTITTQSGFYLKSPGQLAIWVSFIESAGTASGLLTITFPAGYTAVTMAGALNKFVGFVARTTTAAGQYAVFAAPGATGSISTLINVTGVVDTWAGYFVVPTLT